MSVPRGSAPVPRLLHVSDLHFGAGDAHRVGEGLQALIERTAPELVVASGDLTHRGRPDQHAAAAAFLRSLGPPVLAIPGNHDIPYTFPGRFTRTFAEFERQWETTEPVFRSPTLHVVGLNSVRAWRHQSGGIRDVAARSRPRAARRVTGRSSSGRGHASPSDRRAVAVAQEARRTPLPRARRARRFRRGADPRRAHPPGRGQRAARIRGDRRLAESSSRSPPASDSRGPTDGARRAVSRCTNGTRARFGSRRTSGATTTGG